MLTLYDSSVSGNCLKVRLLLTKLGIEFERVEISVRGDREPAKRERFLAGNPRRKVPTVVLEDGTSLSESMAILLWFGDGTRFVPSDRLERQRVLEWLSFEQNNVEPAIAVLRHALTLAERTPDPAVEAFLRSRSESVLAVMDAWIAGREFFVGDHETIADIALFGYSHLARDAGIDLDAFGNVVAWHERMREQPGFVALGS
ncbi:MAG: glutathione S-transferase family protein [Planctomycetes bacterium]|nr:glutathione S-transferase family protein [Planctomycetota bacterium]